MEDVSETLALQTEETMRGLNQVVLTLWRIRTVLEYLFGLVLALALDLYFALGPPKSNLPPFYRPPTLTGLVLLFFALQFFWYLPAAFRRWKYTIGSEFVGASYGIFWRTRRTVPRKRIQYVDITSNPLERMLGVVSLHLHTAGAISAVLVIPGLSPTQAERLRSELLSNPKGDAVSPTS